MPSPLLDPSASASAKTAAVATAPSAKAGSARRQLQPREGASGSRPAGFGLDLREDAGEEVVARRLSSDCGLEHRNGGEILLELSGQRRVALELDDELLGLLRRKRAERLGSRKFTVPVGHASASGPRA